MFFIEFTTIQMYTLMLKCSQCLNLKKYTSSTIIISREFKDYFICCILYFQYYVPNNI